MKKPVLQNYGITEIDLKRAGSVKKWLKVFAIVQMFPGWWLLGYGNRGWWMWIFFIIAVPPYGPLILYFIIKGIFLLFSRSFRAVSKYESDRNAFEKWWIRTKEMFWLSLSGRQFEHELANLYRMLGHKADVTTTSDDKGVDIWLIRNGQRVPVQCKAHKRPIGPAAAREFYGSMNHFKAERGILASLSGFTKGVLEYTRDKPIELVDLNWILNNQKKLENYE
ncbi:MAG: restriction endonuclease [Nitrospirota bacterium]